MMQRFQHHPDGIIIFREPELHLPLAFWLTLEPDYSLPSPATSREYIPDVRHSLSNGENQWGGEFPWVDGDRYLASVEVYAAAWDAANNPEPTLAEAKQQKIFELDLQCQSAIFAGFTSAALGPPHHYSSQAEDQTNLIGAKLAGVDLPYVCTDGSGVKAARFHTAAQIAQVFQDGMIRKQACIYEFHTLRAQVEAATSAEDVAAIAWSIN